MLTSLAVIWTLGPWEILLILLIVVVIFGAKKLPELGKGIGEGLKSFKKGVREASEDDGSEGSSSGGQDTTPRA